MKNLIWNHIPKSVKLSTGRWLQIAPNTGKGYQLYDPIDEKELGSILMDEKEQWVYDGETLSVAETEEVADAIKTHEPDMADFIQKNLYDKS